MKWTISYVFIFLQILISTNACGYYSIVAPGTIQSNYPYVVSVALHKNYDPATIKVGITGPSLNATKTVRLPPSSTRKVTFNVPQLKPGTYTLETQGIKGLIFKNSTILNYKDKQPKIYIQTDKAIYKPGDLVQYRIIVLDENTRPAKLKQSLRVDFKDAAGNFIKQLNDIQLYRGYYGDKLQLSPEPVLGVWRIEASLGPNYDYNTKTIKTFEVDKYVLPKYSVDIETNKDIYYKDPVKITVRSKYTYGKPVKGRATVIVTSQYGQVTSEKTIDVDGKGYVEFNLNNGGLELVANDALSKNAVSSRLIYNPRIYNPPITIFVEMTEEYTGNKQNKTATVNVHNSRYTIEVTDYVYEYVPNKTFEMRAYVKNLDGSPVRNEKQLAKLVISKNYYYDANVIDKGDFQYTSTLDKNGMAVFKVTLSETGYYYQVRVMYVDQTLYLPSLVGRETANTPEDVGPLKLIRITENPSLSKNVIVEVKSNKPIPYYVYAIIGRGNIIQEQYVKLGVNVKSHLIKFKPTFEMIPESYLYVYFVLNGQLIFQEMTLNFPRELLNKIEITAPNQTKPGEEVTLNIKTDPYSFVGLLGIDQSVLLMKTGNDLNSEEILNDLSLYNSYTPYVQGYGVYPGRQSGVVTLTNAHYPYNTVIRPPILLPRIPLAFERAMGPQLAVVDMVQPMAMNAMKIADVAPVATTTTSVEPKIRNVFVETWIFDNINNTNNKGLACLTRNIPDTITSWVVTGFSLNEKSGFGMTANPTNIVVFQPFFIALNLPYSVKSGEVVSIPIVIFNYMSESVDVVVTMENTEKEYDFVEVANDIEEIVLPDKVRVKRITVASNSGQTTSFIIRPKKVGEIALNIKAISPLAGDAINQKLKVEAEGVTQYGNEAMFITVTATTKTPVRETLKANIPKDAVLDSEYLEFCTVGDIMGPAINNIGKLVRKPYGCGEQNMVNFVPNILVLDYLIATGRKNADLEEKAKQYMEIGYQHELTFKHKNGAFSAFGEGSSEPSSWLTAYVARSFLKASKYITVDPEVPRKALEYVVSAQLDSGKFQQTGRLFHPAYQNDLGFTAFALLAILEDVNYANKYKIQVEKGISYIVNTMDSEKDVYALSIAVVVLKKVQHPKANALLQRLENLAKEENGLKWWTGTSKDTNNNIEITSYLLIACIYTEPIGKVLPIVKYLISNLDSNGAFDSTQGTVVGLQALIDFAEKYIGAADGQLTIKYVAQDIKLLETTKGSFNVNKNNSLILQTHILPKSSRQVIVEASGVGSSLVQLSYRYNLAKKDDKPSFTIQHKILATAHPRILNMDICAEFVPGANSSLKESNMAIMEIYLPSGFTADTETFDTIRQAQQVQRVETKHSDTVIIIYFDYLIAGKPECFKVEATKTHGVAKQRPAAITMYDYYNAELRATVYYEVKSPLCDICEGDECLKGCQKKSIKMVEAQKIAVKSEKIN